MAEQIYTIPINEAFDEPGGCPLCRMKQKLERESLEYVMGAAMMEPDVRIRTNRLGFCRNHFDQMLGMKNRLSLALILESHLDEVAKLFPEDVSRLPELPAAAASDIPDDLPQEMTAVPLAPKPAFAKLRKYNGPNPAEMALVQHKSCYVCSRAAQFERSVISNVAHMWRKDAAFQQKLKRQEYFCLDHYGRLLHVARQELNDPSFRALYETMTEINGNYIRQLKQDVTGFCRSFDHQNAGKPLTDGQRSGVDRSVDYLAGK